MKSASLKQCFLTQSNRQPLFIVAVFSAFVILCAATGCDTGSAAKTMDSPGASGGQNQTATSSTPEKRTADQILKEMEATYRKAKTYADEGKVHLHFERDGKVYDDNLNFVTVFERPNKLELICYDAMAASDGQKFRASVKAVPNVVMEVPAPAELTMETVVRDPQFRGALVQGPAGPPVIPSFLMSDNTLAQLLQDAQQPPKLQTPEVVDGRACNRITIDDPDGVITLWIDQQANILRRINLPTADFKKLMDQDGPITNALLVINFEHAQVNQPVDQKAFGFEIPAGVKVGEALVEEVPPATIAPASEPTTLKLTKLWTASDLKRPGNILIIDVPGAAPKILAFDGWRTVVELDKSGKVVARHDLEIPEDMAAFRLRTAVDRSGKRYYVALADGERQFHLFDENWKKLFSFPRPEDGAASGVCDVQLVDLAGKGQLELGVGYWGDVGVQGVALNGERLWRDRSLQFVLHMTPTAPDVHEQRKLLCMNNRGSIVPLNFEGKAEQEIVVPNRFLENILGGDLHGNGQYDYCALASSPMRENFALGVTLDGKELWNYQLPGGVAGQPIEILTTGDLAVENPTANGAKQWIIAGADGSIHLISADGKPLDKFNTGSALAGISAAKIGNQRVLLISKVLEKPEGEVKGMLEAWLVEPAGK